ncbi:thiamine phosphate synthase [bacterium]|nr:thiamine phosphate synthase [bacterium]
MMLYNRGAKHRREDTVPFSNCSRRAPGGRVALTALGQEQISHYHGQRLARLGLSSRLVVVVNGTGDRRWLRDVVHRVVAAGAGMVRYGRPGLSTREMVDQAAQTVWVCRGKRTPCLIEGRVDVALAAMADGVHLGPADMPVALARRLLGPAATIGVTCRSLADAREAAREGASYVEVGERLAQAHEESPEVIGLARAMGQRTGLLVCLGGDSVVSTAEALREEPALLLAAGATVTHSPDPQAVVRSLLKVMEEFGTPPADTLGPVRRRVPQSLL